MSASQDDGKGRSPADSPPTATPQRVLLLGGSLEPWWPLAGALRTHGIEITPVQATDDGSSVATRAAREGVVVIVDLSADPAAALRRIETLRSRSPGVPVVAVGTQPSLELAQRLRKAGAFQLLLHPLDANELRQALHTAATRVGKVDPVLDSRLGKKVLLVDDDADFRESTTVLLEREGYAVVTARTAKEALAKVVSERPDLVILDIMMEHQWAGYEVNQAIKHQEGYSPVSGVPILMVSSIQTPPTDRFRGSPEAALVTPDSYLSKPLDIASFLEAVRALAGVAPEATATARK